jgi:protein-S-isoprenylcysteine O-methyltransferase Ste14
MQTEAGLPRGRGELRTTVRVVTLWTLGFGAIHSLLAARFIKEWVRRRWGDRHFDGLYRIGFNALAVVMFAGLLRRFARLSDRELYHIRPPFSVPMRLVQVIAVLMALDANTRIGIGRITGIQGFWEWLRGRRPIEQNPAQGPQLQGNLAFRTGGAFQLSRHPNNVVPLLLCIANPRMTVRFLTLTLVSGMYLVLGSVHEERRLRAAYGSRYDRYRKGKSFYLPSP